MRKHFTSVVNNDDGTTTITGRCPVTKDSWCLVVNTDMFLRWDGGDLLVQDAFPNLTDGEREQLITGISPYGWDILFSAEDDDDDD